MSPASGALARYYGPLLLVRPPVPATLNEAGVNYKSEVAHLSYSPRRAYEEWLSICEAILSLGGDAVFDFESGDEPYLDREELRVDADGVIRDAASEEPLGDTGSLLTGRVFSANGPWVIVEGDRLRALQPNMVTHRREELAYYDDLLARIAESSGLELEVRRNPHRWEGLADVAPVGDQVVLTHTVRGHYDEGVAPKTLRSSLAGVTAAADFAGIPEAQRIFAELRYPHFHGDTVHFGARPTEGPPVLVQYPGGLYGDGAERVARALGADRITPVDRRDAVECYASNSRQVRGGVLVPDPVGDGFCDALAKHGLELRRIPLSELFGKAGGGPACATLYLPDNLALPAASPLRYSVRRREARARRDRIARVLRVDPGFFRDRQRG